MYTLSNTQNNYVPIVFSAKKITTDCYFYECFLMKFIDDFCRVVLLGITILEHYLGNYFFQSWKGKNDRGRRHVKHEVVF